MTVFYQTPATVLRPRHTRLTMLLRCNAARMRRDKNRAVRKALVDAGFDLVAVKIALGY